VYLTSGLASGHFRRDLFPTREQLRHIGRAISDHLRLHFPKGEEARRYNVLQKLAYLAVVFLILPAIALAGDYVPQPRQHCSAACDLIRRPSVGPYNSLPLRSGAGCLPADPRVDGPVIRGLEQHAFHDYRDRLRRPAAPARARNELSTARALIMSEGPEGSRSMPAR
jgi:hypothetical protein